MKPWLDAILNDAEQKIASSPTWMRSAEWRAEIEKIEKRKEPKTCASPSPSSPPSS